MKQISIRVKRDMHAKPEVITCSILGVYPRFVLLNNGTYNFCADKQELRQKRIIQM